MESFKLNIQDIFLILFEAAVGILLLINPEAFTRTVIILLGLILLVIGVTYLIRYLQDKKNDKENPVIMLISVVTLAAGIVCVFLSGIIIRLITAIAIIFGVILIISGVYKLHNYYLAKKKGAPVSAASLASGIVAAVLGLVIAICSRYATFSVLQIAGIVLIAEAVIDFFSIVQVASKKN